MRRVVCLALAFGCLWLTFAQSSTAFVLPRAKITVAVIDENGRPVEGADVGIGFEKNTGWGVKEIPVEGRTNTEGLFSGSAFAMGHVGFTASKEDFYKSVGAHDFENGKFGRWVPWNPIITIVLRRIENPVPMYARDLELKPLEIPIQGEDVGFDLLESDWVTPYGHGKTADLVVRLARVDGNADSFDSKLTVSFTNKFDGIQTFKDDRRFGSVFKLPRFAPETGYDAQLVHSIRSVSGEPLRYSFREENNYIFRIRSQEENGQLIRAMYGKIHGEIKFDPRGSKTALLGFKYYLNPDYTHNLEFDPTKNLFTDLKRGERVGIR
jgi:hypothetical protein